MALVLHHLHSLEPESQRILAVLAKYRTKVAELGDKLTYFIAFISHEEDLSAIKAFHSAFFSDLLNPKMEEELRKPKPALEKKILYYLFTCNGWKTV